MNEKRRPIFRGILKLFDGYGNGAITRRAFLDRAPSSR